MNKHQEENEVELSKLQVIGYADNLEEGSHALRLPPIFCFKDDPNHILFPPFHVIESRVIGAAHSARTELNEFVADERVTLLSPGVVFEAKPGHTLWLNSLTGENVFNYEPHAVAREHLNAIAQEYIQRAEAAFAIGNCIEAHDYAGIALGADENLLQPNVIIAACAAVEGKNGHVAFIKKSVTISEGGKKPLAAPEAFDQAYNALLQTFESKKVGLQEIGSLG